MAHLARALPPLSSLVLLVTAASAAWAQDEAPNVLLLVDSSGSMEYKVGFNSAGEEVFPQCDPTTALAIDNACPADRQIQVVNDTYDGYLSLPCENNERSRWVTLVEVLTGDVIDYRCDAVDRSSGSFTSLYELQGNNPPDYGYRNPFHRLISGSCSPAPLNVGSPSQTTSPKDEITWRNYSDFTGGGPTCSGTFQDNGLMDQLVDDVRFALMTFDTDPNPSVGDSNIPQGIDGTWSYWSSQTASVLGRPDGCSTWSDMEVGSRNAFAPAWEGRLVGLGAPSSLPDPARNEAIQKVLLATRPFGATPIAGMMTDAYYYLYEDPQMDPLSPGNELGPMLTTGEDPASADGCRDNNIILLTDGEPNLDLRGYCTGVRGIDTNGNCPFDTPANIAHRMANPGGSIPPTTTYVVGFSMAAVEVGGAFKDCTQLDPLTDCTEYAIENNSQTPRALRACCALNEIAYEGGSNKAYFARDKKSLRQQLAEIFKLIARHRPAHTRPVMGGTGVSGGMIDENGIATTFRFFTGFVNDIGTRRGVIERQRWSCADPDADQAKPIPIDEGEGDSFVANVNAAGGRPRYFMTVRGLDTANHVRAERSLRPSIGGDPDGIGPVQTAVELTGSDGATANFAQEFLTSPNHRMLGEAADGTELVSQADAEQIVRWWIGLDNTVDPNKHRCPTRGAPDCNLIADVDYSTPAVVGRPNALLPDESYSKFATRFEQRPLVLYTSSNDGFLHAFQAYPKIDPVGTNNELWAFAPPAVMPEVRGYFGSGTGRLNDGAPVVRDVVATQQSNKTFKLSRTAQKARTGLTTWRTALVQSFGTRSSTDTQSGYFALDVTAPDPTVADPEFPDGATKGGPRFLWQLTTDNLGTPLFGEAAGTPLITTLFFVPPGQSEAQEVAVAVLPGGTGIEDTVATGCTIDTSSAYPLADSARYAFRSTPVHCWESASSGARSLTIVRLDNGEIMRTFRRASDAAALTNLAATRLTDTNLNAPITGQPAPFPGGSGAVADRIYVGDAEGVLWRLDVSSTNPGDWEMRPMFDAFNEEVNPSGAEAGQPIVMPPILSTNLDNEIVILLATGRPDPAQETNELNLVWSLTETSAEKTAVNWYFVPADGERVSGEMQLFNEVVYFSTYEPTNNCYEGISRIYGMHYTKPLGSFDTPANPDETKGGAEMLPTSTGNVQSATLDQLTNDPNDQDANVYGVTVAQVPTCSENADTTAYGGGHTSVSNVRPGKFQLVMHTGKATDVDTGGSAGTAEVELRTPATPARIESWAAIVE